MRAGVSVRRTGGVGALFAAMTAGCAQPYPTPEAMIIEFHPDGTRSACVPLAAPLAARIGAPVPVTAACSKDPGGGSLVYSWSLADAPAGSRPLLGNTDSVTPTFVPDAAGPYRLKLVVSTGVVTSAATFANVVVGTCGGHAPAAVVTSSNATPHVGEMVSLEATVADDDTAAECSAHAAEFDYAWSLADVPAGSHAALNATAVKSPSFTVDVAGRYLVHLVVTDPTGKASRAAELTLDASPCGGHAPAIAGITTTSGVLETGEVVSLVATVSDADTEPSCGAHAATFDYAWAFTALPAGSRASLNDGALAEPSFVPDVAGEYALGVTVTDPTGRSATATQTVTVVAGGPSGGPSGGPDSTCGKSAPVAVGRVLWPGPAATCGSGMLGLDLAGMDAVELDANASSDRDNEACGMGQSLDYAWTLVVTPVSGGKSALDSRDGASTVLRVTSDGVYRVKLVVRDSTGLSSREQFCQLYVKNSGIGQ